MIAVVDYGRGNLFSLGQALRHLGATYEVTADPDRVRAAERVILPGVGAFGDAMQALAKRRMVEALCEVAARGTPLLGICLGMQLLASRSEEFGVHDGLDLIPGTVQRLPEGNGSPGAIRIPNVGWRTLRPVAGDTFLGDWPPDSMVYFVHSYAPVVVDPTHVAATIELNGAAVAAVIHRDNMLGYQFHPEKSGPVGLSLLQRFLGL